MIKMSPRISILVAYALLILALLALWELVLAPPFITLENKRTTLENLNYQISRYETLANDREETLKVALEVESGGLQTWALGEQASAELQSLIRRNASQVGINLSNSRALETAEMDDFNRVGIQLSAHGTHDQIYNFLGALRLAKPLLTLEELTIHSQGGRPNFPVQLSLQLRVHGYQARNSGNGEGL